MRGPGKFIVPPPFNFYFNPWDWVRVSVRVRLGLGLGLGLASGLGMVWFRVLGFFIQCYPELSIIATRKQSGPLKFMCPNICLL